MTYSPNFRGEAITGAEVSASTGSSIVNATGSILDKLTPIRIDSSGAAATIDVSLETAAAISGVTAETIGIGASGTKAIIGIIKDITTAFNIGDVLYISKTGDLTNTKPNIGVEGFIEGDYIIRIGVIGKNELDSGKKDLHLSINVIGRL